MLLWMLDQVRNELAPRSRPAAADVASSYLTASYSAWRLPHPVDTAYAGMTVKVARNDGHPGVSPHISIADQVRQ